MVVGRFRLSLDSAILLEPLLRRQKQLDATELRFQEAK
jgi:hypothetical protein